MTTTPLEPQRGKFSVARLAWVTGFALLYLLLGAGLAAYCFVVNKPDPAKVNKDDASAIATPQPTREPPLVTVPPAEQARINRAIHQAVRYLKVSQQDSGTWARDRNHSVGYAALPGLTLLEAGVPANDPAVQKAAKYVRDSSGQLVDTYQLSLAVLFLDRLGEAKDRELIRSLALRIVAGQTDTGGWSYQCKMLDPADERELYDLIPRAEGLKYNDGLSRARPNVRDVAVLKDFSNLNKDSFLSYSGDNSNTQFAMLALWAARKYDVPLDRAVTLIEQRFRHTQRSDGQWNYSTGGVVSQMPTMTCAGLLGLAVGYGIKNEAKIRSDEAIEKGFKAIEQTIGEARGQAQKGTMTDLYYLWSLERVAVLYQKKKIGNKDWYDWGAEMLLANQNDNGSWFTQSFRPGSSVIIDTCFATLFLRQANLARDLTNKLQRLGGSGTVP